MTKMTKPKRPHPPSPIATELAHLLLTGLSVKIDGKEFILTGAGTVLVPDKHDLRKVVVSEAKYTDQDPDTIESLKEIMSMISDLPPAACLLRQKKWRVLVIVLSKEETSLIHLQDYVDVWLALKAHTNRDIVVFNAPYDGSRFEQLDLEILS